MHSGVTIRASTVSPEKLIKRTDDASVCNRLPFQASNYDQKPRDVEQMHLDYDSNAFKPVPESDYAIFQNSFIKMCFVGFSEHRPITLTPDLLWHHIRNAVAVHVNKHSKGLCDMFVKHEGKMTLSVRRDDFVAGQDNDWPGVFQEFRQLIETNLKESAKPVICERFTTTTETLYDISCISLMDVVQSYFSYEVCTLCGIPSVTLLGELNDWIKLKEVAEHLLNMFQGMPNGRDLEWWKSGLMSVLQKLIQCYQNPRDPSLEDWMARIFKYNREAGSGGACYVTGWVNVFFPYIIKAEQNPLACICELPKVGRCKAFLWVLRLIHADRPLLHLLDKQVTKLDLHEFPLGLSHAPFTWEYYHQKLEMDFIGGPCCITEQVTEEGSVAPLGSLHVQQGWAVAYKQARRSHSMT